MIEGISHITFTVRNLEKTAVFLRKVFDAKEVYSSGKKTFSVAPEMFFMIGPIWVAIMESDTGGQRNYGHVAFKISDDEFDLYKARIESLGVEFKPPRPRIEGEGRSLYFYDYDNHLFELHTGTLEERLKRYAASNSERKIA